MSLGMCDLGRAGVLVVIVCGRDDCEGFPLGVGTPFRRSAGDGESGVAFDCECRLAMGDLRSDREVLDASLRALEDVVRSRR